MKLPTQYGAAQIEVFTDFVSACAPVQTYDALFQALAQYARRLMKFERLFILLSDDSRQLSRTIVIDDRSWREVSIDEIQLSEMDLILQSLICRTASNSDSSMCIPMESAGRIVGMLFLTSINETRTGPEMRFVHFLADCLADTVDRLAKGLVTVREATVASSHAVPLGTRYLAQHDALTDLPNRVLLKDRLARTLELSKRQGKRLAVLSLDLDRFKHINDSLGRVAGDRLLRQVSDRLVQGVHSSDTVARTGGDEFVILLANLEDVEDAAVGAEKIIAAIAVPMLVVGKEICLTMSTGVSIYPEDGEDADSLIQKANTAMYQAKAAGLGQCVFIGEYEGPANGKELESKRSE